MVTRWAWRSSWARSLERFVWVGLDAAESSVIGFTSFRCNITNYYFYFRLIAFVNLVIWLLASENADYGLEFTRAARNRKQHLKEDA